MPGPAGADQHRPSVSKSENGNYVIVWTDNRNGTNDFYVQQYSLIGEAIGKNIKVNEDIVNSNGWGFPWF